MALCFDVNIYILSHTCDEIHAYCVAVSYDSWWKHVRSFWNRRNDENLHFVKYEDLKEVTIQK